jgi:hypothetical protein
MYVWSIGHVNGRYLDVEDVLLEENEELLLESSLFKKD